MDLLEIKSEPPEEFIHMNKNEILKDEFTGETKEILNQEFLIKCENDENETIIPKIEGGLSENELTDKESINENETILLEQGDRNKMNNPSSEGELSEEDNKTIVHQLIDSDGKIWYDELSEETNVSKNLGREPTYGDGNEGIHPKIEEELSEEDDKTIIHELIAADGKIWREEMSCEVTYIPKALPRTSGSQEISYGDQAVYPKIEEELSDEENKTIVHELLAADGKIWTEEMSCEVTKALPQNSMSREISYGDGNEAIYTKIEEELSEEENKSSVHDLIAANEEMSCEVTHIPKASPRNSMSREKSYGDGNEAVYTKIEEELSEEENKSSVHELIAANEEMSYEVTYIPNILAQNLEDPEINYGDGNLTVDPLIKEELSKEENKILICEFIGSNGNEWQEEMSLKDFVKEENVEEDLQDLDDDKQHTIAHSKTRKHKCNQCDYQANEKYKLKQHVEAVHLGIKNYKCDQCNYRTYRNSDLKQHINRIHLEMRKHKCSQCDYQSSEKYKLKLHIEGVHLGIKKHKCNQCDYQTYRNSDLKQHINRVHFEIRKYKCDQCIYQASEKYKLKLHVEAVHLGIKNYKCKECDHQTYRLSDLKQHMNRVHFKIRKYKCSKCDYHAHLKSILKYHVENVHHGLKNQKCDLQASEKSNIELHVDRVHVDIKKCSHCDYQTTEKGVLEEHISDIHLSVKNYECSYCDHEATYQTDLERHMKSVHLGIKKHKCPQCDYQSVRRNQLKQHINNVHLRIRDYKCPHCDYETTGSSNLRRHINCIHLGIKSNKRL